MPDQPSAAAYLRLLQEITSAIQTHSRGADRHTRWGSLLVAEKRHAKVRYLVDLVSAGELDPDAAVALLRKHVRDVPLLVGAAPHAGDR